MTTTLANNKVEVLLTKEEIVMLINAYDSKAHKFNKILSKQVNDVPVILLGGEPAVLKRGKFVLRDISDERQEVARVTGIVSEVLFFEGVVYHRDSLSWMKVEDYQIRQANFTRN